MTPRKAPGDAVIEPPPASAPPPFWLRWLLLGLGFLLTGLGLIGIVLPVLPSTVFFIAAVWAFSKSSTRFQRWLWTHPTFGPPVRDWYRHRAISVRAKVLAVVVMALSFVYVTLWVADDWRLPTALGAVLLAAGLYIVTRPSGPPSPGGGA